MIRKFATVPGFRVVLAGMFLATTLAGTPTIRAQQSTDSPAPSQPSQAQQQPDNPPSGGQEPAEETSSRRRAKPRDYKPWTFTVGGGASLTNGATKSFARSGGGIAAAGVARNFSKYFGFRLDAQFDNLPLRNSALQQALAPGGNAHVYSVTLDPIINIPATKLWSGYIVGGPSYFHRSGELDSSRALPGSACNPFWVWWGGCYAGSLRLDGKFLRSSEDEFGENFGGGIARKIRPNIEIYGEFRYLHGKRNGITTDLRPVTIGVRW
ncbi:exported hypothetical protein [Candidatus Sulfotelmatobacter kueseliae]|uniref:Outer membrane protein beta-barrel domain-containing protein n=1 Tax=Candidatus Sulfotelmatobacter kueseliae TaxID=2042962 RepID=A0A2U3KFG8_9BACT|nr:exported hypothetical protein [Candidatus Sulfotelmatobacter kueseliae]